MHYHVLGGQLRGIRGLSESGSGSAALTLAMTPQPPCAAGPEPATRSTIASMGFP